ncbi:MAG TPA: hypothetical protein V6C84_11940 [Coleofasciculaceae cyanobacterium]
MSAAAVMPVDFGQPPDQAKMTPSPARKGYGYTCLGDRSTI